MKSKKGDRELLRVLDEEYVQKCQQETDFMTERHDHDMETLKLELDTNMKELQEIQVCPTGMLICPPFTFSVLVEWWLSNES